ncbi:MAG TPA: hypothetical protein VHE81_05270 [Lacipirellulaceae bacterium]|nr:hypothetical protein [Lacipirellulaceae bacterium]
MAVGLMAMFTGAPLGFTFGAIFGFRDRRPAKAERIWVEYQQTHDLSDKLRKTAGIDPKSGRVWIGESIQDVLSQRDADGIDSLLFYERVGSKTYYRKGGRR